MLEEFLVNMFSELFVFRKCGIGRNSLLCAVAVFVCLKKSATINEQAYVGVCHSVATSFCDDLRLYVWLPWRYN